MIGKQTNKQTMNVPQSSDKKRKKKKQEEAKSAAAGAEILRVPIHHRCKQTNNEQPTTLRTNCSSSRH
jgi:hypothetical protein